MLFLLFFLGLWGGVEDSLNWRLLEIYGQKAIFVQIQSIDLEAMISQEVICERSPK